MRVKGALPRIASQTPYPCWFWTDGTTHRINRSLRMAMRLRVRPVEASSSSLSKAGCHPPARTAFSPVKQPPEAESRRSTENRGSISSIRNTRGRDCAAIRVKCGPTAKERNGSYTAWPGWESEKIVQHWFGRHDSKPALGRRSCLVSAPDRRCADFPKRVGFACRLSAGPVALLFGLGVTSNGLVGSSE